MPLVVWVILGIALFGILNIIDYRLTKIILNNGGKEFNPIARFLMKRWGFAGLFYLKLVIFSLYSINAFLATIDLYTVWYLNFMFAVMLGLMYHDGRKTGVIPRKVADATT